MRINPFSKKEHKTELESTYEIVHAAEKTGIKCLDCGRISWNPVDVKARYCGYCHDFHEIKMLLKSHPEWPRDNETTAEYLKRRNKIMWLWDRIEPWVVGVGIVAWVIKSMVVDVFFRDQFAFAGILALFYGYMIGAGISAYYIRRWENKQKEEVQKRARKNT